LILLVGSGRNMGPSSCVTIDAVRRTRNGDGRCVLLAQGSLLLALGFLLLALGGIIWAHPSGPPRRPVAPPVPGTGIESGAAAAGQESPTRPDAVILRIHSLLVGSPWRRAAIDIVPLFARRPSEASDSDPAVPRWDPGELRVQRVASGVVRIRHSEERSLLVVPGLFLQRGKSEFQLLRVDLVAPGAALYAPVHELVVPHRTRAESSSGILSPRHVGLAILGESAPVESGVASARGVHSTRAHAQLARDAVPWFEPDSDATLVGCVVLVGGEPLAAYVFASRRLFQDAWPDLLQSAVMAQRRALASGVPIGHLVQRANRGNPQGRALALLRRVAAERPRIHEVPGGGLRWFAGGRAIGYVASALIAGGGRVLFVSVFRASSAPTAFERGKKKSEAPDAEPEEDPTKRRGGRFNPFRKGDRIPLVPPR